MTADVIPIGVPSRAELWRRLQLARAVLNHRPADPASVTLALRVLDGVSIDELVKEAG